MQNPQKTFDIAFMAIPGVQLLDIAGPLDVFSEANRQSGRQVYNTRVIAMRSRTLETSSKTKLLADGVLSELIDKPVHTFIIAGAHGILHRNFSEQFLRQLTLVIQGSQRFGSVCAGAVLLAQTGLLTGRTITTHWELADEVALRWPDIRVNKNNIFVHDDPVWTAAGVTASLDLALAIVQNDLGEEIAKLVASHLVMYFQREGGQLQFSRNKSITLAGRSSLQELQRWAIANITDELSLSVLARRMGITTRHLTRLFKQEIGQTPARWVASLRLNQARQLLEQGLQPKQVSSQCGYGDVEILRRAFTREFGLTPTVYRRRYR